MRAIKWTKEYITEQFVPDEHSEEIRFPWEIKGIDSPFEVRCANCGVWYKKTSHTYFQRGQRCRDCIKGKRWTKQRICDEFKQDEYALDFRFIEPIKNQNSKFEVLCSCGEWYIATIDHFFNSKSRCRDCIKGKRWTWKRVQEEFQVDEYAAKVEQIEQIKNCYSRIKIICATCDNNYEPSITSFFDIGRRCPHCKKSSGEMLVASTLEELNIQYKAQKRFRTCKNKTILPFDFYLPQYKKVIEYHGEHHYHAVNWSGNLNVNQLTTNLLRVQLNDLIKKKWCDENNIQYVEIPYWNKDKIPDICERLLST